MLRITILALSSTVWGQVTIHRTLSVEDGLTQSQVNSVCLDNHGYLWIATLGGLSRWDGFAFDRFLETEGLPSIAVAVVKRHVDQGVWAGCWGGGVAHVTAHGAQQVAWGTLPLDANVWDMATKQGQLVACATDDGVFLENTHLVFDTPRRNACRCVLLRNNGTLAVGTLDGLVLVAPGGEWHSVNTYSDHPMVVSLLETRAGELWVGTFGKGLFKLEEDHLVAYQQNGKLLDSRIACMYESQAGDIYFGTHLGVNVDRHGTLRHLKTENGLPHQMVHAMTQLEGGSLLFGTFAGVCFYDPLERITNVTGGLRHPTVNGIAQRKDGTVLISTYGGGLHAVSESLVLDSDFSLAHEKATMLTVAVGSDQDVFGGMDGGGFYLYGAKRTVRYSHDQGLRSANVTTICPMTDRVLFGTYDGVYQWQAGQVKRIALPVPACAVTQIVKVDDHEVLVATDGWGVFRGKPDDWEHLRKDTDLPVEHVSAIALWQGKLVIGHPGRGIWIEKDGGWQHVGRDDGLASLFVVSLLATPEAIAAGTLSGLAVVRPEGSGWVVDQWNHRQGLAGDECQSGALFMDRKSRIWVGTNRGVSVVDLNQLGQTHVSPPKLDIKQIQVGDSVYTPFDAPKSVAARDASLEFQFVGIDLEQPQAVSYQYRLGKTHEWRDLDQRELALANLDNGSYVFELRARSGMSLWSDSFRYAFKVLPYWWTSWWFVGSITLVLLGLGIWVIRWRFQQVLALERIRAGIAADLHDNLGAGLSQIAILSEVLLMREKHAEGRTGLISIRDTARELVDSMSDIVWLVNPKRDRVYDLVGRLRTCYESIASLSDIRFTVVNQVKDLRLPMDTRQQLYLVFKEAIVNSIKHSGCSALDLTCQWQGRWLQICLRDDGCGFDPQQNAKGNGLDNMRTRVESFHGALRIESVVGVGTTICVSAAV